MGRHVIWPLGIVGIGEIFRRNAFEKFTQVAHNSRVGIFLHNERRRCVADEDSQQTGVYGCAIQPGAHGGGDFRQSFAAGSYAQTVLLLKDGLIPRSWTPLRAYPYRTLPTGGR